MTGIVVMNGPNRLFFVGIVFSVLLHLDAAAFDYPSAKGDAKDIRFYQSPSKNLKLIQPSGKEVRNVILCIGDGMSFNQVAMARQKAVGPEGKLWMELLPISGVVRTYSADSAVTDSAAAATAIACGIKADNGTIGIGPDGKACASILELLEKRGFRTGLVATSTITHATPAAFASHVESRGSEEQIAEQMFNQHIDVLFGGGRKYWLPAGTSQGGRSDMQNLLEEAILQGYCVIETKAEMDKLSCGPVIGLFAAEAMTTYSPEPALFEMAQKAIDLLTCKSSEWFAPDPKFFLMVEGSQVDWAGHANDTDNSIRQILMFDMAVKAAIDFAKVNRQTLVIVTADHETGGLLLKKDKLNASKIDPEWDSKDHTGADVPLFAYGPGADEFAGTMDNTEISRRIAELLWIEDFPQPVTADGIELQHGKRR